MKPARCGPFPYSPIIHRPPLQWPNGAHVALWVIPNIEFFALDEKVPPAAGGTSAPVPDVPTWSSRDYGNRVGVFRLMEVLDRHGIRATVALNSEVCAEHPVIIEEGNKRNWEWMGHCESNTRRLNEAPPGDEPRIIKNALATIERATGARPRGWLGSGLQETWDTLDLLAAEGGHEDDRHQGEALAHLDDQLQAVHLGHVQVGEDEVGGALLDQGERLEPVLGEEHLHLRPFRQQCPREVPVHGVVVHHQYRRPRASGRLAP